MLTDLTINEFTARLASRQPAPGGGSAAALSGLLGASLVEMAIVLSRGRQEFAPCEGLLAQKEAELARLRAEMQFLVDRDGAAFNAVVEAFDLPEETEAQQLARSAAIAEAVKEATEVPLLTARACLAVLEAVWTVLDKTSPNTFSDLMIGALAGQTGIHGALLNIAINMPLLKDEELAQRYRSEGLRLRRAADSLIARIGDTVYGKPVFAGLRD